MQIEHKVIPHCIWDNDCDNCQASECVATYDQALKWYGEHEIYKIIDSGKKNPGSDDDYEDEEGW